MFIFSPDSTSARFLSSSGIKAGFLQAQSAVTVYSKQGFRYGHKTYPPPSHPHPHSVNTF